MHHTLQGQMTAKTVILTAMLKHIFRIKGNCIRCQMVILCVCPVFVQVDRRCIDNLGW